jgi:hypothetical protein
MKGPNAPIKDAKYWYGHAPPTGDWHYHSPNAGHERAPSMDTVIGYALDGFKIYGSLDDVAPGELTAPSAKSQLILIHTSTDSFLSLACLGSSPPAYELDECNGVVLADGTYRYHTRNTNQVDSSLPYCSKKREGVGNTAAVNWKYIIGCYKGELTQTVVRASNEDDVAALPADCTPAGGGNGASL